MTLSSGGRRLLLGIDAGGTKTECTLISLPDGGVVRRLGEPSNYQAVGIVEATRVWRNLIEECCVEMAVVPQALSGAGLGIAGLDRPRDEARIVAAFDSLLPATPRVLVNDAYLVLRAGTADGVGVTAISGTGANAMGESSDARRCRVNGLGPDFGDLGSASDIGAEAVRRAFRSLDGREQHTQLVQRIAQALHLNDLTDLVDLMLFDCPNPAGYRPGYLAPLVFQAANDGDAVAADILRWAGDELGLAALAVARKLFLPEQVFPVVLGGSVLQKGRSPFMLEPLMARIHSSFPLAKAVVLTARPVLGAVRYALDVTLGDSRFDPGRQVLYKQLDDIVERFEDLDTVALVRKNT